MRFVIAALLVGTQALCAQTSVGPLQKGATVRVWSARQGFVARKGFIDARNGDTLTVKFPGTGSGEYDDRWTMVTLQRWEVDTIDVLQQGRWWRADFSGASPRLLPGEVPSETALSRVTPQTPVRVWSAANRLKGSEAVLVNQRGDTIDFVLGEAPGATSPVRPIRTSQLERLEVPAQGWDYPRARLRGFGFGMAAGIALAMGTGHCSKSDCRAIPYTTPTYGIIGGVAGMTTGWLLAWRSHHRWKAVDLR
jgi:hypothetical protein